MGGEAAVDGNDDACDVRAGGHAEEGDDGSDLARFADAAHGRAADDGVSVNFILEHLFRERCVRVPRCDGVDPDVIGRPLARERSRELIHRALAHGVHRARLNARESRHGGVEHDPPVPARLEHGMKQLTHLKTRLEIRSHQPSVIFAREIRRPLADVEPDVVHQDVQRPAKLLPHRLRERSPRLRARDVARAPINIESFLSPFAQPLLDVLRRASAGVDSTAGRAQRADDGLAESLRAAGDERGRAVEGERARG